MTSSVSGSLYMRCQTDTYSRIYGYEYTSISLLKRKRPLKSYWEAALPDSYYLLFTMSNWYSAAFVGWTTRQRLLDNYDDDLNNQSERTSLALEHILANAEPGYPTICLHHSELYCPYEFIAAMQARRLPQPILVAPIQRPMPVHRRPIPTPLVKS